MTAPIAPDDFPPLGVNYTMELHKQLRLLGYQPYTVEWDGALAAARAYGVRMGLSTSMVAIPRADAQRILAVLARIAGSWDEYEYGETLDHDETAVARRLAQALGADLGDVTSPIEALKFPHTYVPGYPTIADYRQKVRLSRGDVGAARGIEVTRPEYDSEVLARLGGAIPEQCMAGYHRIRCGKPAGDPIHSDQMGD